MSAMYDDREPNQHVDFVQTPWSWCSNHTRPEHIEWAGINCRRTGWYRTEHGAREDNEDLE
jgi:hypothetical protein